MMSVPRKLALIVLILILSILACNMPQPSSPTPFAFPTPNLTLTSVFRGDVNAIPTATFPLPGTPIATPTSPATNTSNPTSIPPTATTPSTSTSEPPSPTPVPPSATLIPTQKPVTYEGPAARQNTSVTAVYMSVEPKIDGVFDEWNLDRYPVNSLVYGGNNWKGEDDLSGNIMVAWDDAYLYIAARVKDDLYVQNATGEKIYQGDSVEFLFDRNVAQDYYLDRLDGDDYQLGISPGIVSLNNYPENYLWYPEGAAGYYQKVKASATPADGGYRLEMKVPWNILGVSPANGQHFGFAFSFSDNDNPNKNVQQSLVSNVASRILTDPTTWGDLTLVK